MTRDYDRQLTPFVVRIDGIVTGKPLNKLEALFDKIITAIKKQKACRNKLERCES